MLSKQYMPAMQSDLHLTRQCMTCADAPCSARCYTAQFTQFSHRLSSQNVHDIAVPMQPTATYKKPGSICQLCVHPLNAGRSTQ